MFLVGPVGGLSYSHELRNISLLFLYWLFSDLVQIFAADQIVINWLSYGYALL